MLWEGCLCRNRRSDLFHSSGNSTVLNLCHSTKKRRCIWPGFLCFIKILSTECWFARRWLTVLSFSLQTSSFINIRYEPCGNAIGENVSVLTSLFLFYHLIIFTNPKLIHST